MKKIIILPRTNFLILYPIYCRTVDGFKNTQCAVHEYANCDRWYCTVILAHLNYVRKGPWFSALNTSTTFRSHSCQTTVNINYRYFICKWKREFRDRIPIRPLFGDAWLIGFIRDELYIDRFLSGADARLSSVANE